MLQCECEQSRGDICFWPVQEEGFLQDCLKFYDKLDSWSSDNYAYDWDNKAPALHILLAQIFPSEMMKYSVHAQECVSCPCVCLCFPHLQENPSCKTLAAPWEPLACSLSLCGYAIHFSPAHQQVIGFEEAPHAQVL